MGAGKLVSDASVDCPGGSAFFEPRARFSVGELALWLLRPLDADYELSPLPSRPDLSVNLALVRAAFSALVAYTPDAVRASTEARAEAVPVEGTASARVAVGTAAFCVMPVTERVARVDWTPGEWVLA